jgi:hypothetical protein
VPALLRGLPARRATRVAAAAFVVAGVGVALSGVLPMDCSPSGDEVCLARSNAGDLSWLHYAHLWLGLLVQLALTVTPFAIVRTLWPRPISIALLVGAIPAVVLGIVAIPLYDIQGGPHGLINRVELAIVHYWVLLVAGGTLHVTRGQPRLPEPAPLRPREFFGRAWTGEGQVMLHPLLLWRRFGPRFRARREITWLTDETFVVEDRAEFRNGHVERRRRFCELVAPDRFRVTSVDLLEPTEVLIDERGFRVAPYRVRVPYGPVGVTLRCRDELRLEPDGTLLNTIHMRFLGLPAARVETRARLTDA